jgi:hypothetical protein
LPLDGFPELPNLGENHSGNTIELQAHNMNCGHSNIISLRSRESVDRC